MVQGVRTGDINGVDLWVGQQIVIGSAGDLAAEFIVNFWALLLSRLAAAYSRPLLVAGRHVAIVEQFTGAKIPQLIVVMQIPLRVLPVVC